MSHQINLFNPSFVEKEQVLSARMMLLGLIPVLLVGILFYIYSWDQVSELESHVAAAETKLTIERDQMTETTEEFSPQKESALLVDELQQLESKLSKKQVVVDVLNDKELGNLDGYSEYMRAFSRQLIDGLWLTGFTINNTGMTLSGRLIQADLLPAYLQRLKNEKVMQGKSFSNLQIKVPGSESDTELGASVDVAVDYFEFTLSSFDSKREE